MELLLIYGIIIIIKLCGLLPVRTRQPSMLLVSGHPILGAFKRMRTWSRAPGPTFSLAHAPRAMIHGIVRILRIPTDPNIRWDLEI